MRDSESGIWAALRKALHAGYAHGDHWRGEEAAPLRALLAESYKALEPQDEAVGLGWLFAPAAALVEPHNPFDWNAYQARCTALQDEAVASIWLKVDRLEVLARICLNPTQAAGLGLALARATSLSADEKETLILDEATQRKPLRPWLVAGLAFQMGDEWVGGIGRKLGSFQSAVEVARVIQHLPMERRYWRVIDGLGADVAQAFWKGVPGALGQLPTEDLEFALDRLLVVERTKAAVEGFSFYADRLAPPLALRVLQQLAGDTAEVSAFLRDGSAGYHINRVFEVLDKDPELAIDVVAPLELALLPFIEDQRGARRLYAALGTEASAFIDLVSLCYRPDVGKADQQVQVGARTAQRVLHAWKGFPGSGLPAEEREAVLQQWSMAVLSAAKGAGRLVGASIELANVLARCPEGPDGFWPCLAAREIVEARLAPHFASQLRISKYNLRGVTSRAVGAGGEQERKLSKSYEDAGISLRSKWPLTAEMLGGLSLGYSQQAEGEDAQARTDRRGFLLE